MSKSKKQPEGLNRLPRGSVDKATIKRLMSYLTRGYKLRFTIVLIMILISACVGVLVSLFLRVLIDDHITPMLATGSQDFSGLLRSIIIMAVISLVGVISSWIYERMMAIISQSILKDIRDEMFVHMQSLPVSYFDRNSAGDIMSHYTNDTDALRQMMAQSIPQVISAVATIITVAVAMIATNLPLTIFVALYLVMMLKVIGYIAGNSGQYFVRQQASIAKLNGYVEEMMEGQKVIKVFNHEDKIVESFNDLNDELEKNTAVANRYANILMPTMGNLGNLLYILLAMVGGALAIYGVGGLTLGIIASFLQLSKSITQPLGRISQQLNMVVMAMAGAKRIFSFLDIDPEVDNGTVELVNVKYDGDALVACEERTYKWAWQRKTADSETELIPLEGKITFNNVDFAYVEGKDVLHDISLWAEGGEKIAFVGATAAGKTTITNLINRFYDISRGEILYDGINISDIRKKDLRHSLGIVLQDTHLFTGTIVDNIRYGRPDASLEEIKAAAELANAHGFIKRLPHGYDTVLEGGGAGLSQGQRQLLSIARAAIADPPVMILDEATSSIDTRTELMVQNGMDALMYGRTVFVIAHRLSTIQDSDVIMVMDMGKIVERGNHDRLLEKEGIYFQLYTGSFDLVDSD